ncbi:hypothetical protein ACIQY5_21280 [Peribacillus frigoritolerans]|uniref:hypothetical protein n=1 Tax=Peribacillus frigoritolerans TaxID=450367 RepID=UPI00380DD0B2
MGRRSKDFKITKEELEDLYLFQKRSQNEIGKILGCTRHTIASYLKKYEIERRSMSEVHQTRNDASREGEKYKFSEMTVELIMEHINQGYTIEGLAKEWNVNRDTIGDRLIANGIHLKSGEIASKRAKERLEKYNHLQNIDPEKRKEALRKTAEKKKQKARERWWGIINYEFYTHIAHYLAQLHFADGKKPKGMVIDHILSVRDGWKYGVYVEDISHPNNLRLIPEKWNLEKHMKSHMTLEEFKKIVPNARFFRHELPNPKCLGCDVEFIPKATNQLYCTKKCYKKNQIVHIERVCRVCGAPFVITRSGKINSNTCSDECLSKLKSKVARNQYSLPKRKRQP